MIGRGANGTTIDHGNRRISAPCIDHDAHGISGAFYALPVACMKCVVREDNREPGITVRERQDHAMNYGTMLYPTPTYSCIRAVFVDGSAT